MSFSKRVIKFDFLGTAAIPLKQLAAGHFLLRLIPRQWPGVGSQKWRKLGTDNVIELQVTLRDWLTRRIKATDPVFGDLVHEHLLSERRLQAGVSVIELLERREAAASMMVQAGLVAATSTSSSTTPTSSSTAPNECLSDSHVRNGHLLQEVRAASTFKSGKSGHKVDALRSTLRGTLKLAFAGALLMACQATSSALCPTAVYPAINSLARWKLQATEMEKHHLLPLGTCQKAETLGHFSMGNMQECMRLRNRMGLEVAFCGGAILMGMLAARSSKGMAAQVKSEALKEAKAKAAQAEKDDEEARALIGPRGGLPTLRGDLVRLAALLNVPIDSKMTVAQIKEKVKPPVELLKGRLRSTTKPLPARA